MQDCPKSSVEAPAQDDTLLQLRLHHIGVVTPDLPASLALYTAMGYVECNAITDPGQNNRIVLMQRSGEPLIELIAPDNTNSPAWTWLQRIIAGAYHTCYETHDLERTTTRLRRSGVARVYGPVPAIAFGMRRVSFLWGRATGLIELLESDRRLHLGTEDR